MEYHGGYNKKKQRNSDSTKHSIKCGKMDEAFEDVWCGRIETLGACVRLLAFGQDSSSLRLWILKRFVLKHFVYPFFDSSQNHYVPLRCLMLDALQGFSTFYM